MGNNISKVPSWALLTVYLLILVILAVFGDLFTFVVGAFIISLAFINRYDAQHVDDH